MRRSAKTAKDYYFTYTVLFCFTCLVVYFSFIVNGKSFLWYMDGMDLHWNTLAYYGEYLRSLVGNIVSGNFSLPEYDFSLGYGSPIIPTLHWDVIGDPFNLLSFFVKPQGTEHLLTFLVILRLYLAGIAFSAYCFYMKKDRFGTLAGTFSYIFCGYSIFTSIRHPHFLNPMILFPLLLIGVERISDKKKHGTFAFLVFISIMTSFYFSYMLGLFTVIYFLLRYFVKTDRKSVKDFLLSFAHILIPGVIGIMMACVIMIPVIILYLGGLRISSNIQHPLLYSIGYYQRMITDLLIVDCPGSWTRLGVTVTVFIAAMALLGMRPPADRRARRSVIAMKIALAGSFIMFFIPAAGSALNGFNYVSNRWEWMFAAVSSYTLAYLWPDLFALKKRQKNFVFCGVLVYVLLMLLLNEGVTRAGYAAVILLVIAAGMVYAANQPRSAIESQHRFSAFYSYLPAAFVALTIFNVCLNAHYFYDAEKGGYIYEFGSTGMMYPYLSSSSAYAVSQAEDSNNDGGRVVRYEDQYYDSYVYNKDSLVRTNGTEYYYSLANGYISQYLLDMGTDSWWSYRYEGLKGRTFLDTLAGVKYYTVSKSMGDSGLMPYGFSRQGKYQVGMLQYSYDIYTNRYALPLGYSYSSYITRDVYDSLNCAQKAEALLQGVLLEDDGAAAADTSIQKADPKFTQESVNYKVHCGSNVKQMSDGSFMVGKEKSSITLSFDGLYNCETYLYLSGVNAQKKTKLQLYLDDDQDILSRYSYYRLPTLDKNDLKRTDFYSGVWDDDSKVFIMTASCGTVSSQIQYRKSSDLYYIGQKDYLTNFGYSDRARNQITITFPTAGIYSFDDMEVICQPMTNYVSEVSALSENVLENEKHGTDSVTGTVDLSQDKVLLLTIPYDKGWTAWADGREVPVYRANVMNSALILKAGHHDIKLVYKTPGLRPGAVISLAGLAAFALMLAGQRINRRRRKTVRR